MQNQILDALNWRYATKQFDPGKKIDTEKIDILLESLRLAPSSFGLQPWKFIVITNQELKNELRQHSWDQSQISDCSHLVVHCVLRNIEQSDIDNFIQFTADSSGMDPSHLDQYKQMMSAALLSRSEAEQLSWSQKQVYISQGILLEAAALLEVDACPMEGFSSLDYDRVLNLADSRYTATVLTALGYRSEEDKYAKAPKIRYPKDQVIEIR